MAKTTANTNTIRELSFDECVNVSAGIIYWSRHYTSSKTDAAGEKYTDVWAHESYAYI